MPLVVECIQFQHSLSISCLIFQSSHRKFDSSQNIVVAVLEIDAPMVARAIAVVATVAVIAVIAICLCQRHGERWEINGMENKRVVAAGWYGKLTTT